MYEMVKKGMKYFPYVSVRKIKIWIVLKIRGNKRKGGGGFMD